MRSAMKFGNLHSTAPIRAEPQPGGALVFSWPPPAARTVLILEDDKGVADLLNTALTLKEFAVTRVINGAEGLKCILASDYDVILCDMVMPGFPGDMFFRAVERVRPHLCRRFIFMTGHTGDPRITDFVRSVGGFLLWKPFEIPSLLEAVRAVLKAHPVPPQAEASVGAR
jgi:DNA-binding NtrC family response regulator